jgi:hypothetical protein
MKLLTNRAQYCEIHCAVTFQQDYEKDFVYSDNAGIVSGGAGDG